MFNRFCAQRKVERYQFYLAATSMASTAMYFTVRIIIEDQGKSSVPTYKQLTAILAIFVVLILAAVAADEYRRSDRALEHIDERADRDAGRRAYFL